MMAELTIRQASQRATQIGRQMGISSLNRMARTRLERQGARSAAPPGTAIGYWLRDEDKLLQFINTTTSHEKQPKVKGEA